MSSDGQGQEGVAKNLGLSGQANPFYSPSEAAILEAKHYVPAHFPLRATGGTISRHIVKCHRRHGCGRLMNPPFPSSQWAFLWVKN